MVDPCDTAEKRGVGGVDEDGRDWTDGADSRARGERGDELTACVLQATWLCAGSCEPVKRAVAECRERTGRGQYI